MDSYNPNLGNQNNRGSRQPDSTTIASLVLGIISVACVLLGSYAFIGVICGIIGIFLGISARKNNPSTLATVGFALSIAGVAASAVTLVSCLACVGCFGLLAAAS